MHEFALALLLDRPILKSVGKAYDLFDLFGEIGGLVQFFCVIISVIVQFFSSKKRARLWKETNPGDDFLK